MPPSQEAPPQGPNSPALSIVAQETGEPSFIIRYESMEASMVNRIGKLERENSIFIRKGGVLVRSQDGTQQLCLSEYLWLLEFENRDLGEKTNIHVILSFK
uniref:Uncharacterized protein n=1 Tax=Utricularia reniformis TaxID=192314 RepID=A0A1Y0B1W4_9LAMI|nr:hypothetical protein AEK19_MT1148 [Utricularia reniformis]ART31363.1 hypothetical protein AEK19_MT1148 [Utricularia reniformis]